MFNKLIASGGLHEPRPLLSSLFSVSAHIAILAAVVVAGRPAVRLATAFETRLAAYLFPHERHESASDAAAQAGGAAGMFSARVGPTSGSTRFVTDRGAGRTPALPDPSPPRDPLDQERVAAESVSAFLMLDVDSAAVRDPLSRAPVYPPELEQRHVEGSVRMNFVVDSTGLIDLATVKVIEATNPLFTRAVLDAMPGMHFRPAMMGPNRVRQFSQQDFKFLILSNAATGTSVARRPPVR